MFTLGSTLYVMWFCEFWQMYHAVKFHWPKSPVSYFLLPQLLATGLIVSVTSRTSQMWVTASLELARCTWLYRTEVLWGFSVWPHRLFLFMQNHKPFICLLKNISIFPKSEQLWPKHLGAGCFVVHTSVEFILSRNGLECFAFPAAGTEKWLLVHICAAFGVVSALD